MPTTTYGTNVSTLPNSSASSAPINIRTDIVSGNSSFTLINKYNPYGSTPTSAFWGVANANVASGSYEYCYYYYTYYSNTNMNATIYIYCDDVISAYLNNNIIIENIGNTFNVGSVYTIQLVTGFNFFKFVCINNLGNGWLAFVCINNNNLLFNTNSNSANDPGFKNIYIPMSYNYLNPILYRFSNQYGVDGTVIPFIWNMDQTGSSAPIGTIKFTYTYVNKSYADSTASNIDAILTMVVDDYVVVILNKEFICWFVGGPSNTSAITLLPGNNYFEFYCTNSGGPGGISLKCVNTSNSAILFSTASTYTAWGSYPYDYGTSTFLNLPDKTAYSASIYVLPFVSSVVTVNLLTYDSTDSTEWIWNNFDGVNTGTVTYYYTFYSDISISSVSLYVFALKTCTIYLNNVLIKDTQTNSYLTGQTSATYLSTITLKDGFNAFKFICNNNYDSTFVNGCFAVICKIGSTILFNTNATSFNDKNWNTKEQYFGNNILSLPNPYTQSANIVVIPATSIPSNYVNVSALESTTRWIWTSLNGDTDTIYYYYTYYSSTVQTAQIYIYVDYVFTFYLNHEKLRGNKKDSYNTTISTDITLLKGFNYFKIQCNNDSGLGAFAMICKNGSTLLFNTNENSPSDIRFQNNYIYINPPNQQIPNLQYGNNVVPISSYITPPSGTRNGTNATNLPSYDAVSASIVVLSGSYNVSIPTSTNFLAKDTTGTTKWIWASANNDTGIFYYYFTYYSTVAISGASMYICADDYYSLYVNNATLRTDVNNSYLSDKSLDTYLTSINLRVGYNYLKIVCNNTAGGGTFAMICTNGTTLLFNTNANSASDTRFYNIIPTPYYNAISAKVDVLPTTYTTTNGYINVTTYDSTTRWIWASENSDVATLYYYYIYYSAIDIPSATIYIFVDDKYTLYVNNLQMRTDISSSFNTLSLAQTTIPLVIGYNYLKIVCTNTGSGGAFAMICKNGSTLLFNTNVDSNADTRFYNIYNNIYGNTLSADVLISPHTTTVNLLSYDSSGTTKLISPAISSIVGLGGTFYYYFTYYSTTTIPSASMYLFVDDLYSLYVNNTTIVENVNYSYFTGQSESVYKNTITLNTGFNYLRITLTNNGYGPGWLGMICKNGTTLLFNTNANSPTDMRFNNLFFNVYGNNVATLPNTYAVSAPIVVLDSNPTNTTVNIKMYDIPSSPITRWIWSSNNNDVGTLYYYFTYYSTISTTATISIFVNEIYSLYVNNSTIKDNINYSYLTDQTASTTYDSTITINIGLNYFKIKCINTMGNGGFAMICKKDSTTVLFNTNLNSASDYRFNNIYNNEYISTYGNYLITNLPNTFIWTPTSNILSDITVNINQYDDITGSPTKWLWTSTYNLGETVYDYTYYSSSTLTNINIYIFVYKQYSLYINNVLIKSNIINSYLTGNTYDSVITLNTGYNYIKIVCNNTITNCAFAMICKSGATVLFNTNNSTLFDTDYHNIIYGDYVDTLPNINALSGPINIVSRVNYNTKITLYDNTTFLYTTCPIWFNTLTISTNNEHGYYYYSYYSQNVITAKIYIIVYGTYSFYLNNIMISSNINNSYVDQTQLIITLIKGINLFKFYCVNNYGESGFCVFSCVDNNGNYLFNTNSTSNIDPQFTLYTSNTQSIPSNDTILSTVNVVTRNSNSVYFTENDSSFFTLTTAPIWFNTNTTSITTEACSYYYVYYSENNIDVKIYIYVNTIYSFYLNNNIIIYNKEYSYNSSQSPINITFVQGFNFLKIDCLNWSGGSGFCAFVCVDNNGNYLFNTNSTSNNDNRFKQVYIPINYNYLNTTINIFSDTSSITGYASIWNNIINSQKETVKYTYTYNNTTLINIVAILTINIDDIITVILNNKYIGCVSGLLLNTLSITLISGLNYFEFYSTNISGMGKFSLKCMNGSTLLFGTTGNISDYSNWGNFPYQYGTNNPKLLLPNKNAYSASIFILPFVSSLVTVDLSTYDLTYSTKWIWNNFDGINTGIVTYYYTYYSDTPQLISLYVFALGTYSIYLNNVLIKYKQTNSYLISQPAPVYLSTLLLKNGFNTFKFVCNDDYNSSLNGCFAVICKIGSTILFNTNATSFNDKNWNTKENYFGNNTLTLPNAYTMSANIVVIPTPSSFIYVTTHEISTRCIWTSTNNDVGTLYYYFTYYSNIIQTAFLYIYVYDTYSVYVNNIAIIENKSASYSLDYSSTITLMKGTNYFKIICTNNSIIGGFAMVCIDVYNNLLFNTNDKSDTDNRFNIIYQNTIFKNNKILDKRILPLVIPTTTSGTNKTVLPDYSALSATIVVLPVDTVVSNYVNLSTYDLSTRWIWKSTRNDITTLYYYFTYYSTIDIPSAKIYIFVDDTVSFYINNITKFTNRLYTFRQGEQLSTYETVISLITGYNFLKFVCVNTSGNGRFAMVCKNDTTLLFNTNINSPSDSRFTNYYYGNNILSLPSYITPSTGTIFGTDVYSLPNYTAISASVVVLSSVLTTINLSLYDSTLTTKWIWASSENNVGLLYYYFTYYSSIDIPSASMYIFVDDYYSLYVNNVLMRINVYPSSVSDQPTIIYLTSIYLVKGYNYLKIVCNNISENGYFAMICKNGSTLLFNTNVNSASDTRFYNIIALPYYNSLSAHITVLPTTIATTNNYVDVTTYESTTRWIWSSTNNDVATLYYYFTYYSTIDIPSATIYIFVDDKYTLYVNNLQLRTDQINTHLTGQTTYQTTIPLIIGFNYLKIVCTNTTSNGAFAMICKNGTTLLFNTNENSPTDERFNYSYYNEYGIDVNTLPNCNAHSASVDVLSSDPINTTVDININDISSAPITCWVWSSNNNDVGILYYYFTYYSTITTTATISVFVNEIYSLYLNNSLIKENINYSYLTGQTSTIYNSTITINTGLNYFKIKCINTMGNGRFAMICKKDINTVLFNTNSNSASDYRFNNIYNNKYILTYGNNLITNLPSTFIWTPTSNILSEITVNINQYDEITSPPTKWLLTSTYNLGETVYDYTYYSSSTLQNINLYIFVYKQYSLYVNNVLIKSNISNSYLSGNTYNSVITLNTEYNYIKVVCSNTTTNCVFAMICKNGSTVLFNTNINTALDINYHNIVYGNYADTLPNVNAMSSPINIILSDNNTVMTSINKYTPYGSIETKGIWGVINNDISLTTEYCYYYYTYYANTNVDALIYIGVNYLLGAYLNNNVIVKNRSDDYITDIYYKIQLFTGFNFFKFICINTTDEGYLAFLCVDNNGNYLFNTNINSTNDLSFKNIYMPMSYNYLNTDIHRFIDENSVDGNISNIWNTLQDPTSNMYAPVGTVKYTYKYVNNTSNNINATLTVYIDDTLTIILNKQYIGSFSGLLVISITLIIGNNYFEFYCTNTLQTAIFSLKCINNSDSSTLFSTNLPYTNWGDYPYEYGTNNPNLILPNNTVYSASIFILSFVSSLVTVDLSIYDSTNSTKWIWNNFDGVNTGIVTYYYTYYSDTPHIVSLYVFALKTYSVYLNNVLIKDKQTNSYLQSQQETTYLSTIILVNGFNSFKFICNEDYNSSPNGCFAVICKIGSTILFNTNSTSFNDKNWNTKENYFGNNILILPDPYAISANIVVIPTPSSFTNITSQDSTTRFIWASNDNDVGILYYYFTYYSSIIQYAKLNIYVYDKYSVYVNNVLIAYYRATTYSPTIILSRGYNYLKIVCINNSPVGGFAMVCKNSSNVLLFNTNINSDTDNRFRIMYQNILFKNNNIIDESSLSVNSKTSTGNDKTMLPDPGASSAAVVVLGDNSNYFDVSIYDPSTRYIWNSTNTTWSGSGINNNTLFYYFTYYSPIELPAAKIYIFVDEKVSFFINNTSKFTDRPNTWKQTEPLSTYETTISLLNGYNFLKFKCMNYSGIARFAMVCKNGDTLLFNTNINSPSDYRFTNYYYYNYNYGNNISILPRYIIQPTDSIYGTNVYNLPSYDAISAPIIVLPPVNVQSGWIDVTTYESTTKWIWSSLDESASTIYYYFTYYSAVTIPSAIMYLFVDNTATFYLNNVLIRNVVDTFSAGNIENATMTISLIAGYNYLKIVCTNTTTGYAGVSMICKNGLTLLFNTNNNSPSDTRFYNIIPTPYYNSISAQIIVLPTTIATTNNYVNVTTYESTTRWIWASTNNDVATLYYYFTYYSTSDIPSATMYIFVDDKYTLYVNNLQLRTDQINTHLTGQPTYQTTIPLILGFNYLKIVCTNTSSYGAFAMICKNGDTLLFNTNANSASDQRFKFSYYNVYGTDVSILPNSNALSATVVVLPTSLISALTTVPYTTLDSTTTFIWSSLNNDVGTLYYYFTYFSVISTTTAIISIYVNEIYSLYLNNVTLKEDVNYSYLSDQSDATYNTTITINKGLNYFKIKCINTMGNGSFAMICKDGSTLLFNTNENSASDYRFNNIYTSTYNITYGNNLLETNLPNPNIWSGNIIVLSSINTSITVNITQYDEITASTTCWIWTSENNDLGTVNYYYTYYSNIAITNATIYVFAFKIYSLNVNNVNIQTNKDNSYLTGQTYNSTININVGYNYFRFICTNNDLNGALAFICKNDTTVLFNTNQYSVSDIRFNNIAFGNNVEILPNVNALSAPIVILSDIPPTQITDVEISTKEIWTSINDDVGIVYYYYTYYSNVYIPSATIYIFVDDQYSLYVNNQKIREYINYSSLNPATLVANNLTTTTSSTINILKGFNYFKIICYNTLDNAWFSMICKNDSTLLFNTNATSVTDHRFKNIYLGENESYEYPQIVSVIDTSWSKIIDNTSILGTYLETKYIWTNDSVNIETVKYTFYYNSTSTINATIYIYIKNYCTLIVNDVYIGIISDSYISGNNDNFNITLNTGVNYLTFYCTNNSGYTGGFAMICKNSNNNYLFNTNDLSSSDNRWVRTPMYIASYIYPHWTTFSEYGTNNPVWVWNVPITSTNNIIENNKPFTYYYYYNCTTVSSTAAVTIYIDGICIFYLNGVLMQTLTNVYNTNRPVFNTFVYFGINEFKFRCINNKSTQGSAGFALRCSIDGTVAFRTMSTSPLNHNWVYKSNYYYCKNVNTSLLVTKSDTINTNYNTKYINFINSLKINDWTVPNNFGYKINGIDIATFCCAKYYDFTDNYIGTLPTWVTSIKVICISGGSGGNGGNYTTSGTVGLGGKIYTSEIIITTTRVFIITIGSGGDAGYGNSVSILNGTLGQIGEATLFTLGTQVVSSDSGITSTTQYITDIVDKTTFGTNYYYGKGGDGGLSGSNDRTASNGNNGLCRIFLFN